MQLLPRHQAYFHDGSKMLNVLGHAHVQYFKSVVAYSCVHITLLFTVAYMVTYI